jgi:hypothetical protein
MRPPTDPVKHSNGNTVSESGHLIFVTIRTALLTRNPKLNFYVPNMMNIIIRHEIYCPYLNLIWEVSHRKKNYLHLYPHYPFVSNLFSSLHVTMAQLSTTSWETVSPSTTLFSHARHISLRKHELASRVRIQKRGPLIHTNKMLL